MHHAQLHMDVVEVDPAITRAAREYFFLDELLSMPGMAERLNIITADGRAYLEACAASGVPTYDAIVNDSFSGGTPVAALVSVEAARAAKACLKPGGLYLANVVSAHSGTDVTFLRDCTATLLQVFSHVIIAPCSDEQRAMEDNYLLVATDADAALDGQIAFDGEFPGRVLRDVR